MPMSAAPHHAVHLRLAGDERDLDHFGHDAAEALVQRHTSGLRTTTSAGRQWLAPPGLVGRELEHGGVARHVFEQLQAKGHRVLLGLGGQLVDEALGEKTRCANGPPSASCPPARRCVWPHARCAGSQCHRADRTGLRWRFCRARPTGPASAGRQRSMKRGVTASPALVICKPIGRPCASRLACITATPAGR